MMHIYKLRFAFILGLLVFSSTKAQIWTWIGGANPTSTVSPGGTYTNQGVPTTTNLPGGKTGLSSWKDLSGNIWVFGGAGAMTGTSTNTGYCNDLWKYVPSTGQWTWMKGSDQVAQACIYGTLGVPGNSTTPGTRGEGATWVDNSGNLWLFGGNGNTTGFPIGLLNDLWKYNPSTNQWTWVSGPAAFGQGSKYGTLGVPSTTNNPGGRMSPSTWTDAAGDLWLLGGFGLATYSTQPYYLSDLWRFKIATNEWTWMGGYNYVGGFAIYGASGVASPTYAPGSRYAAGVTQDASGNVWLFGGKGVTNIGSVGPLSDLWKYSPASGSWAWISGIHGQNSTGSYGTVGVPSTTNSPGSRYYPNFWNGNNGNLYVLGGQGTTPNAYDERLEDFWRYTISTDEWTWVSGSTQTLQPGNYGTQGVPSLSNKPGARMNGANWTDNSGNLWMFGGSGIPSAITPTVYLQDVWKYETCSTPTIPTNVSGPSFSICSGNIVTLNVTSHAPVLWYNSSNVSVGNGTSFVTMAQTAGTNTFFAKAQLCQSSPGLPMTFTVNLTPTLSVNSGSMCTGESFTIVPSGALSYTISGNATIVAPANTATYLVTGSSSGCPASNSVVSSVSVYISPTVSIVSTPTICSGLTLSLSAGGANSYTWSTGTVSSGISLTASLTNIYSVIGESSDGCKDTEIFNVNVFPSPTLALSVANATICETGSFTIQPSGAATYSYSGGSNVVTPLTSSIYTVLGFSPAGCVSLNTPTVSIQVKVLPTVTLSGANSVCQGVSVSQLVNTSAVNFTWSNGSNNNLVVLSPTVTGICSLTVTASNGCTLAVNKIITVNALPPVMALANSTNVCFGRDLVLNGQGALNYSWSHGATNNLSFSPSAAAIYTVTGTDVNGCINTATIGTALHPLPLVTVTSISLMICVDEPVILTANGALSYVWNTGANTNSLIVTPSITTLYSVSGTDANGCVKTVSLMQVVDACSSVKETDRSFSSLAIYPNPGNGEFTIKLERLMENTGIEIYNLQGELLVRKTLLGLVTEMNISDRPAGIYLVFLKENGRAAGHFKIIKQS